MANVKAKALSADEVFDTLRDVLTAIRLAEPLFKKFDFASFLGVALQAIPLVQEVIQDAGVFVAQFLDLDPGESATVVLRLQEEFPAPTDTQAFILELLNALAETHKFGVDTVTNGEDLINLYQNLIQK